MEGKQLIKAIVRICIVFTILTSMSITVFSNSASAQPIVLKGITPWIPDYQLSKAFFHLQKAVREKTEGKVVISYLGGPEVADAFDQFEALRNGIVDVILAAGAYYRPQIPEAGTLLLTRLPASGLRKSGYYNLMYKIHLEKGNVILLGIGGGQGAFRLYSNKKIEKPDLKGLRFRVSPVYVPLVKALNGTPVMMKPPEVYQALERGVIDGYGWPYIGMMDMGWHEVTKYVIDHPFYSMDSTFLMNRESFNKLPENLRELVKEAAIEAENEWEKFFEDRKIKENERLTDAGLQFIKFSEADENYFIDTAYEEGWKEALKDCPEYGPKLKELSK